ncbi:PREDICTED: phosphoinositide 3-kinase adapter protein 1 [Nicrophorus vespilloides]|uniref:Phosphoinositide 3-kinase adapter protein 1 n=1 Tax=Nicrophorus vespilloides TaxID=110193 RepID=A0ABM1NKG1_NICVS|nr:PREDICTED: phosphoinositide 3-kinase adapter protein 1 [Nicrophorus vespilloides]
MDLDNPSYFSMAGKTDSSSPQMSREERKKQQITRSLLRSVSTNSGDSNQELLIMGEPRLSDIAPELSSKYPQEPRRANSLKSNRSEPRTDLIYSPLPTSEDAACSEASDDEEVFLNEDCAKYYNLTAKAGSTASRRRHSISSFMDRERSVSIASSSKSYKEELPQATVHATPEGVPVKATTTIPIDDHSLRHGSYPRKRCNRCTRGSVKRAADMDDILIISVRESEAAKLWVDYFVSYFEQFGKDPSLNPTKPYKVHHLGIEDIIEANGDVRLIAEKTSGVKLQLIVLCPMLLKKIADNLQSTASLSKILLPDRILALQLGTSDDDITDLHKTALCSYSQWQRRGVGQDQDAKFVQDFVTAAMAIFTKVWKQQSSIATEENSQFSVSPKKIRMGQTSVLVLLTYPLQKEDVVKITIVKNDEFTEVKTVKRRNPYTLKIAIPEKFLEVSAIVTVLVEKNGSVIGKRPIKCESRLRELEQILRSSNNPVEFMCQTLGFSPHDTEQLDNWMVHMFQKNVPPNFNFFINQTAYSKGKSSNEEYPTLLHFAARFGLEKLAVQLLDSPGGEMACDIRNINDCVPVDIADNCGHLEISKILRDHMKMNELTNIYIQLKDLSESSKQQSQVPKKPQDEVYLKPTSAGDFYKLCPAPKPVLHSPLTPTIAEEPPQYLQMDKVTPMSSPLSEVLPSFHQPKCSGKTPHHTSQTSINSVTKNVLAPEDKVQVELAEIINDFKNNVHTITQTEQLVAEWQNRNYVQRSFKEKKEQLEHMRLAYEQLQRDMKSKTKKTGTFDMLKKLFGLGSSSSSKEEKLEVGYPQNPIKNDMSISNPRPVSSLSIQSTSSSSSSGRISTISGCSLGDSGTHSDHEERKNIINSDTDRELSLNYMIPPAPKPIKQGMFAGKNMFPTIEERPPHPVPRPGSDISDSYYIQFPPNGSPVEVSRDSQEYINFPIKPQSADRISHEYMNFKAP